jgi:hypothetical protein
MRSIYQGLCPIQTGAFATHFMFSPYLYNVIYTQCWHHSWQWCFLKDHHSCCCIKFLVYGKIFWKIYLQPSLYPVGCCIQLLHDAISAGCHFSDLCIDPFRHIWKTVPSIDYKLCDCFWIFQICFLSSSSFAFLTEAGFTNASFIP